MKRRVLLIGAYGYIGSSVFHSLATSEDFEVVAIDLGHRGNPAAIPGKNIDYLNLAPAFVREFDEVILLAGHSSVGACFEDEEGALRNNVVGVHRLLESLDSGRLIYASSGSVYDGCAGVPAGEDAHLSAARNIYDFTKIAGDELARLSGKRAVGLRFGTVSGLSPNTRAELLVNKMTADALSTGTISLANPRANRAILGLSDLVSAVMLILGDPAVSEGCYNLCSENVTMLDVATQIANLTGASVEYMPGSPTYDFSMSIEKARTRLGWKPAQTVDSIAGEMVATHRP